MFRTIAAATILFSAASAHAGGLTPQQENEMRQEGFGKAVEYYNNANPEQQKYLMQRAAEVEKGLRKLSPEQQEAYKSVMREKLNRIDLSAPSQGEQEYTPDSRVDTVRDRYGHVMGRVSKDVQYPQDLAPVANSAEGWGQQDYTGKATKTMKFSNGMGDYAAQPQGDTEERTERKKTAPAGSAAPQEDDSTQGDANKVQMIF